MQLAFTYCQEKKETADANSHINKKNEKKLRGFPLQNLFNARTSVKRKKE
jgi:hypothetical protein